MDACDNLSFILLVKALQFLSAILNDNTPCGHMTQ